jgi:hypothetical protein
MEAKSENVFMTIAVLAFGVWLFSVLMRVFLGVR